MLPSLRGRDPIKPITVSFDAAYLRKLRIEVVQVLLVVEVDARHLAVAQDAVGDVEHVIDIKLYPGPFPRWFVCRTSSNMSSLG